MTKPASHFQIANRREGLGAVLFDLDGTLVDTAPDFVAVIERLCLDFSFTPPSYETIHANVSNGARALTTLATGLKPDDARFSEMNQTLLDLYADQIVDTLSALYPGMPALLDVLTANNLAWGVVTNKPERFSLPLLKSLGLHKTCQVLVCPDHVKQSKPHPEPLLLACTQLGRHPHNCIYVGDHPRDIDAGKAAGMLTIAAAYGYLPQDPPISSWGADCVVASVEEMRQLICPLPA